MPKSIGPSLVCNRMRVRAPSNRPQDEEGVAVQSDISAKIPVSKSPPLCVAMRCCRLLLLTAVLACWAIGKGFGIFQSSQLDSFLSDPDKVESQIDCVLGRTRCDDTGRKLMVAIPEVLVRQCRLCSPDQAANARIVMDFIRYNYPLEWQEIVAKYGRRPR